VDFADAGSGYDLLEEGMLEYQIHSAPDESGIGRKQGPGGYRSFNFHFNRFRAELGMTRNANVSVSTFDEPVVVMLRFDINYRTVGEVI